MERVNDLYVKFAKIMFFVGLVCVIINYGIAFLNIDFAVYSVIVKVWNHVFRLIMPVVMTVVVAREMMKQGDWDWKLLLITLSTGFGAALYPIWSKITSRGNQMQNLLTFVALLFFLYFGYGFLKDTPALFRFAARNDWAQSSYILIFLRLLAVVLAFRLLGIIKCKHLPMGCVVLILSFLNMDFGILLLLLFSAIYGDQYPAGNPINKYVILLFVFFALKALYNLILHHYVSNGGLGVNVIVNVWAVINLIFLIAMIILLVKELRKMSPKGKVWLVLPAIFNSAIFSIIAIHAIENEVPSDNPVPMI